MTIESCPRNCARSDSPASSRRIRALVAEDVASTLPAASHTNNIALFPERECLDPGASIYLSSTLLLTASAFEERRRSFLPRSPKTGRFKPKGRANSRAIVIATQATDVPTPALRYRSVFCRLLAKKCELKRDAIGLVM